MARRFRGALMAFLLTSAAGCALPSTVQRLGADYNSAVAGLSDELTLLNIVRAREGLPLHYTTFGRLSGSLTVRGSASLNTQLRESAPTDLRSRTTTNATTGTTIAEVASRSVLSGGTLFSPTMGLEVNTGPSFDISVLDTQEFFQGILTPVPVGVINSLLLSGYDSATLLGLLAARVELRLKQEVPGLVARRGDLLLSIENTGSHDKDEAFARIVSCFMLSGDTVRPTATPLAPLSRITGPRGQQRNLTLQELALLDGRALDISAPIPAASDQDTAVNVVRPGSTQQVARLSISPGCTDTVRQTPSGPVVTPQSPPAERTYVGRGMVMVASEDGRRERLIEADVSVTFRSPEAVIQFLGRCLAGSQQGNQSTCKLGDRTLFAVREEGSERAVVTSRLNGQTFSVADDEHRRQSLAVLSLLQRLINLQKRSTDRPVTVPVQIVP